MERERQRERETHKEAERVRDESKYTCAHAHTRTHKPMCNGPSAIKSSIIRPLSLWAMARPCHLQAQESQPSMWVISSLTRSSQQQQGAAATTKFEKAVPPVT